ncbi:MAG: hypothetical protein FWG75_05710 [Cystobacterineae bacterium]|nr:hypothetical protein [Cystobacterineae bacterium]
MQKLSPLAKTMREMAPWLDAAGRITGGLGFGALLGWALTGYWEVGAWGWGLGLGLGALLGLAGFIMAATRLSQGKNREGPP